MIIRKPLVPLGERYFEDYPSGLQVHCGEFRVSEDDMLDFAHKFDPQLIHTDPTAAAEGPFGGLISSGWHTAAISMRLMVDHFLNQNASLGGIGVDALRWPNPVRPDDILSATFTVTNSRRSKSKPDRGLVHTTTEVMRQDGETVLSMETISILRLRPPTK